MLHTSWILFINSSMKIIQLTYVTICNSKKFIDILSTVEIFYTSCRNVITWTDLFFSNQATSWRSRSMPVRMVISPDICTQSLTMAMRRGGWLRSRQQLRFPLGTKPCCLIRQKQFSITPRAVEKDPARRNAFTIQQVSQQQISYKQHIL